MGSQMFYLIIEPKYYDEASRIYRNIAKDGAYYGFGIVDIASIQKINPVIELNSLAEELEIDNEYYNSGIIDVSHIFRFSLFPALVLFGPIVTL